MRKAVTCLELVIALTMLVIVLGFVGCRTIAQLHKSEATAVAITGKERGGSEKGKWIVFGKNETFEVSDTIVGWRWDSSDTYGKIEVGKTYNFQCRGYRVPFFSWYRNIMDVEKVTPEKNK